MTVRELTKLRDEVDRRLPAAKREAIAHLKAEADRLGVTLEDVFSAPKRRRRRKKAEVLANKPRKAKAGTSARWIDKNGVTWSGRGRHPKGWDKASAMQLS